MRKKTSVIWQLTKHEFQDLIDRSVTIGDVLAYFGLRNKGSNYKTLRRRAIFDSVDISKFSANYGRGLIKPIVPLDQILIENSTYTNRHCLKKRLIKLGLLKQICRECGIGPEWNGKSLSLSLDHINGISDDNRLENLRLLCPNCHSQTPTFAGKHKKKNAPLGDL